jgi:hypothetical protein
MMDRTWEAGGNITDFWMANINFGHALFRSYQFLMHLVIWVAHRTVFSWMGLERAYNTCITLFAMAMPWTYYKGWRIFGLSRFEAVAGAIAAVLVHEAEGYGIGLTNDTYSGYGTYTQMFATMIFPLAVGYLHRVLRDGTYVVRASIACSVVFLSHILTGYFLCLWVAVDIVFAAFFERVNVKQALRALAKFSALCLLWTGWWLIPMAQDTTLQRASSYEASYKFVGHGATKIMTDLSTGRIMDADRFPVITLIGAAGLLFCLAQFFRKRTQRGLVYRKLAIQTIFWFLISFGPLTWGPLIEILPLSKLIHWHRAFAIMQIALSLSAGVAVASFWYWLNAPDVDRKRELMNFGAGAAFCTALLVPCLKERQNFFYYTNTWWLNDMREWWQLKDSGYQEALRYALAHDDARYYAGHPWNYGNDLKTSGTTPFYALLVQFNVENVGSIHHHQDHTETLAYSADWRNKQHLELMNVRYVGLKAGESVPVDFKAVVRMNNGVLYDTGMTRGYFGVGVEAPGGCADNAAIERSIKYYLGSPLLPRHVYPRIDVAKRCDAPPYLESAMMDAEKKVTDAAPPGAVLSSGKRTGPNSNVHWAKVHMNAPGLLLFKMSYHPGWHALVNGKPAETHSVMPMFTGIPLEKGDWDVELQYEVSRSKKVLLWVSFLGALALFGWFIARRRRTGARAA